MSKPAENLKVVVRCRPLSAKEEAAGHKLIVKMDHEKGQVALCQGDTSDPDPKIFRFNAAFPWDCTQQLVYDDAARPIVDAVLEGFNGTIFAYGQTGTGKTYSMEGVVNNEEHKGIILHAFDHIFSHISTVKDTTFLVRASFLQIYMEDVSDLLGDSSKKLHVRQADGDISVVGLSTHIVKSPEEITKLLLRGKDNRAVGFTAMNSQSSRSHSVFTIVVEQQRQDGERTIMKMGKLHLVDLAGSERLGKTEATGQRAKEGAKINQSLLALGNVISALVTGAKHVAYRDSKLTQLLQDSLGGNSKTVMVATLGPASYNYDETLSTLLYATRAKDIKNAPKVNEDPKDALLNQLKAQIELLKKQLADQNENANCEGIEANIIDKDFLCEVEAKHRKQMEELMASKSMNEEQKAAMRARLDGEYERQKQVKAESDDLQRKIQQMEQTVLVGGVNLVDKAKQQEEEIRAHESRMRRQQEEQNRLADARKQEDTEILMAERRYGSLKEELTEKSKKIEKIKGLVKHLEESIEDLQVQFEREKEVESQTLRTLQKEYALLRMIAESFIPADRLALIEGQAAYDDANQRWLIPHIEKAGRHQIVEEVEEQHVFIQGIDGPMKLSQKLIAIPATVDVKKAAQALKKRKIAAKHALNEFALVPELVASKPK
jgi:kinesin family protein 3/17